MRTIPSALRGPFSDRPPQRDQCPPWRPWRESVLRDCRSAPLAHEHPWRAEAENCLGQLSRQVPARGDEDRMSATSANGTFRTRWVKLTCQFIGGKADLGLRASESEIDPACVKTPTSNLRVEISSRLR